MVADDQGPNGERWLTAQIGWFPRKGWLLFVQLSELGDEDMQRYAIKASCNKEKYSKVEKALGNAAYVAVAVSTFVDIGLALRYSEADGIKAGKSYDDPSLFVTRCKAVGHTDDSKKLMKEFRAAFMKEVEWDIENGKPKNQSNPQVPTLHAQSFQECRCEYVPGQCKSKSKKSRETDDEAGGEVDHENEDGGEEEEDEDEDEGEDEQGEAEEGEDEVEDHLPRAKAVESGVQCCWKGVGQLEVDVHHPVAPRPQTRGRVKEAARGNDFRAKKLDANNETAGKADLVLHLSFEPSQASRLCGKFAGLPSVQAGLRDGMRMRVPTALQERVVREDPAGSLEELTFDESKQSHRKAGTMYSFRDDYLQKCMTTGIDQMICIPSGGGEKYNAAYLDYSSMLPEERPPEVSRLLRKTWAYGHMD